MKKDIVLTASDVVIRNVKMLICGADFIRTIIAVTGPVTPSLRKYLGLARLVAPAPVEAVVRDGQVGPEGDVVAAGVAAAPDISYFSVAPPDSIDTGPIANVARECKAVQHSKPAALGICIVHNR